MFIIHFILNFLFSLTWNVGYMYVWRDIDQNNQQPPKIRPPHARSYTHMPTCTCVSAHRTRKNTLKNVFYQSLPSNTHQAGALKIQQIKLKIIDKKSVFYLFVLSRPHNIESTNCPMDFEKTYHEAQYLYVLVTSVFYQDFSKIIITCSYILCFKKRRKIWVGLKKKTKL